jgi:DNA-binding XRE family transcriptional regulator
MLQQFVTERELMNLVKRFRRKAGKTRSEAAREMRVSQTSIFHAEETPNRGLLKLRMRMITAYSGFKMAGPYYCLSEK